MKDLGFRTLLVMQMEHKVVGKTKKVRVLNYEALPCELFKLSPNQTPETKTFS